MIRKNVAEILAHHVTFELEAIDRMYLNAYVPSLQTGGGFVYFVKSQLGALVPSTTLVAPISDGFVRAIERFVQAEGVDLVTFEKGERKDDVAQQYLARFDGEEGVVFVGKAQEKASVFRTEKRRDPGGKKYPWIIRSTAMPNHDYFYLLDRDFGPLFIKFCSYFPYPAKLCLNGHEWLKRQLTRRGIPFEPLDNGIRSTEAARRVQQIADRPRRREDRRPLPQVAPALAASLRRRPPTGGLSLSPLDPPSRVRPDAGARSPRHRPLLLRGGHSRERRPGASRSDATHLQSARHPPHARPVSHPRPDRGGRALVACGVQALRTETTIKYDFGIARALRNLPALREIGFAANRRLLHVESLSHDCLIGEDCLRTVTAPITVQTQRAAGLRFADPRVHALMHALCLFALAPTGFRHRDLRQHVAQLHGRRPDTYSAGSMTYDLRRLRLHALIERVPRSHRYRVTPRGAQVAMFYARLYTRALRPACSLHPRGSARAQRAFERLDAALADYLQEVQLAA